MGDMRPGTKVPFWSPRNTNKPAIEPPFLLRLVSGLCILSVVAVLVHGGAISMGLYGIPAPSRIDSIYIAVLHFLLPIGITYTIVSNNPLSRFLLSVYFIVLYTATVMRKGFLGTLGDDETLRLIIASGVFIVLMAWLFRSPRMRVYYLLLNGKPIPADLASRAYELATPKGPGPKTNKVVEWVVDHLEIIVMVGFIVLVIYAWASAGM